MKNIILAYFFAIIGGLFGFHHIYLARTQHALLWLTTFGGFGFGLFYELFLKLNHYVRQINNDQIVVQSYQKKIKERKSPAFELKRFLSQYLTSIFYGFITYYAFPDTWHSNIFLSLFIGICTSFSIAFGVQLAGTLGPRQCSFIWPLLGAILGLPFLIGYREGSPSFNIAVFISCWIFEWKIEWNHEYFCERFDINKRKSQKKQSFIKRCLIYGSGGIIFGLILTSVIYQNLQVDINGERVKIKDVLKEFFKSNEFIQIYQQLISVIKELYAFYLQYGFKGLWTHIWAALDSESDKQAYEVLNLRMDASQQEIDTQCRVLSRKWHPDRFRNPEEKKKAEVTFMNIQQACDRLSNERKRRQTINTQKRDNPN